MAVRPPDPLVAQLRGLERPRRPGVRWTREDQWHVTVAFLASVEAGDLVTALDGWSSAGAAPGSAPGALTAVAGPRPAALAGRVWAVPVTGLDRLAASLGGAVARLPGRPDRPPGGPFRGHLTLARARRPSGLRDLPAPPLHWSWKVTEVEAVRSELHRDGARHESLGRWLLPPLSTARNGPGRIRPGRR